jgi:hypothetical protein
MVDHVSLTEDRIVKARTMRALAQSEDASIRVT